MSRATVGFLDARGNFQAVKASRPLPTTGGGGGTPGGPYVEQTTLGDSVYGTDSAGEQSLYGIDATAGETLPGRIAVRDSNGGVSVPLTPTESDHAVSKQYVDALEARIEELETLMLTAIQGDGTITALVAKTQAQYDALPTKVATTQYTIKAA